MQNAIKLGILVFLSLFLPWVSMQLGWHDFPWTRETANSLRICEQRKSPECYRGLAARMLDRASLGQNLSALQAKEQRDKQGYFTCHILAHYLGQESFARTGALSDTLASCTMACGGGCFHGAVEKYFSRQLSTAGKISEEMIRPLIPVCGSAVGYPQKGIYIQCVHGLGHAMMFVTDGNLPRALKLCDFLSQSDRKFCYAGVFMENVGSATGSAHPSRFLRDDDPLYPCDAVEEQYARTCYTLQSFHFIMISNNDWDKAAEFCNHVPDPYRAECFLGLEGIRVYTTTDPDILKTGCDIIGDPFTRNECVKRIVIDFSARFGDSAGIYMRNFCSVTDLSNREGCYRQIGKTLTYWMNQEKIVAFCKSFDENVQQEWCLRGMTD